MKEIQPSQANNKVLGEAIAGKISKELKKRKNAAQDLIDGLETHIKYRL